MQKAGLPEPEFREQFGGLSVHFRKTEKTHSAQVEARSGLRGERTGRRPELQPESLDIRVMRHLIQAPLSKAELSASLGHKEISGHLNKIIRELLQNKTVEYTIPNKPQSRMQKYRLTDKGRRLVAKMKGDKGK